MNRAFAFVLLTLYAIPLAMSQCAIRPIKPIPPIGCKDVTPECASDSDGKSHWIWICVRDNAGRDTINNPAWKPRAPKPVTPSEENVNTVQTAHHNSVNAPFQESTTAIGVPIGEMGAGEQHAAEQLRAIAEGIKNCSPEKYKLPPELTLASDGFIETEGPPINVVWNVELSSSARTRYLGSIEYVFPFSEMPPSDLCNKRGVDKRKCRIAWEVFNENYKRQDTHPRQFRYEFDVTRDGLEFLRAFTKVRQTDDEPWVAGGINSEVCANTAIKSTLNNPNNAAQTSTSPSASSAPALQLAATQASLSIESTPSGADIEIDGAFVGSTPSTVNVGPGSHQIAVKKKGFAEWTKALSVTGGMVQLNAELEQEAPK